MIKTRWTVFIGIALVLVKCCVAQNSISQLGQVTEFYVSPNGNDGWSGKVSEPNNARSDGPFATLEAARDAIRRMKGSGALLRPVTVYLRGGTHVLEEPFLLTDVDSGTNKAPITYSAYQNERPVISGGKRITGWRKSKRGEIWEAEISEVRNGKWYFRQLFVNGIRRQRARTPNTGFFQVDGRTLAPKPLRLKFRGDDIKPSWAGSDTEIVMPRAWTVVRYHFSQVDAATHTMTLSGEDVRWVDEKDAHYWVENTLDALDSPGEWYLDRHSGVLYYWPMPGEDLSQATVIAPRLQQLVRFGGGTWGSSNSGESAFSFEPAHNIRFIGLMFSYTDWTMPPDGYTDYQGGFDIPAAIEIRTSKDIEIRDSFFAHLGQFAIELGKSCQEIQIVGNEFADLGAGGIKVGEPKGPNQGDEATTNNVISDNRLHSLGVVDPGAYAVWVGQSSNNTIVHNEIYDVPDIGIGVGWTWGYVPSGAYSNTIAFNHLHDIGGDVMGDLACIYLLGVQPGTVIHHNVCHDVKRSDVSYGGWGIYTDEGSSNMVIENNIVYRTQDGGFHHHYGQKNVIRNNVFALGQNAQLRRTDDEAGHSFDFEHNIVYWTDGILLQAAWKDYNFHFDNNLYYQTGVGSLSDIKFGDWKTDEWQEHGQDVHSIFADPKFVNPAGGDFSLQPDSPAFAIGFEPIDVSTVGPRLKH